MTHETPIPGECAYCATRREWRAAKAIGKILIPVLFTATMAALGVAGAAIAKDTSTSTSIATLRENRIEDIEARQRLAAEVVDMRSKAALRQEVEAERWTAVQTSLARIETQIKALDARRGR